MLLAAVCGQCCLAQPEGPQVPEPAPRFDAASVKLAAEESRHFAGRRIQTSPGSLVTLL
jgi:hypothetical protein